MRKKEQPQKATVPLLLRMSDLPQSLTALVLKLYDPQNTTLQIGHSQMARFRIRGLDLCLLVGTVVLVVIVFEFIIMVVGKPDTLAVHAPRINTDGNTLVGEL